MACKKYEGNGHDVDATRINTQQTQKIESIKKKYFGKQPSKLVAYTCVQPIEIYPMIC
jgi:hypothetical protein